MLRREPPNGGVECRWGIGINRDSGLIAGYRRLLDVRSAKNIYRRRSWVYDTVSRAPLAIDRLLNVRTTKWQKQLPTTMQCRSHSRRRTILYLKISSFCHVVLVDMPFCFFVQNFAEIGQSVDELWPKKRFSRWRPPPSWILRISLFGHVTVIGFNCCCSVPNFIKIGRFLTEIWWFNDFQNGGRPPSWISRVVSNGTARKKRCRSRTIRYGTRRLERWYRSAWRRCAQNSLGGAVA